ncbi:hypothetical protein BOW53_11480 [Solemya pervernicosa gill symbiont]|uniref:Spore protein YkvP/CgeB glycosyl transferase-like domain-containing protein n=2 Tax=Gammaproteobacteria incertae sedis TaxID=118884 RepID=A0A1T2L368_9GAMM|nr:glycosyltransferase [Candidatus Reidiella endopervernicosa]OOZ39522.1 hypothetical protein BOW53_11480 [Solemya pervernicosa gill symbiont]QKQ25861.1 glycosyltransferase [Candidatus Reidiella endopervernicosa]
MRIVHIDNLMIRRFGRTKVSTGRRLFNGMVRNNYKVCEYSDRDISSFTAPLRIKPLGRAQANRHLIETCENFRPDFILMGHCDLIENETLAEIRKLLPAVKIAYRNLDPLWDEHESVKMRESNISKIQHRMPVVDAIFITTGGELLKQFQTDQNVVAFLPNATDAGWDDQNNAEKREFKRDLMFCGVGNKSDDRYTFAGELHQALGDRVSFESFGMHGYPAVWGLDYEDVIATSKMGLNLNRYEGYPLYSSDRIAQLMGNGLLTCLWDSPESRMREFFSDEQVLFFRDLDQLVEKLKVFKADDAQRRAVAAAGRAHYHEHFSGERVIKYMVETTFGLPYSYDYLWQNEVYRR